MVKLSESHKQKFTDSLKKISTTDFPVPEQSSPGCFLIVWPGLEAKQYAAGVAGANQIGRHVIVPSIVKKTLPVTGE